MNKYSHRQVGMTMPMIFGATILLFLWLIHTTGIGYAGWLAIAIAMLGVAFLSSLTIEVAAGALHWKFGLGLFQKSVPVADIAAVEITRTRWWEGWGIRFTRRGWLYNVAGLNAVAVRLKSGKQFLLGSDEPEGLAQALMAAITPPR